MLEIGTGCGIIALECSRKGANVVCTDINPYAINITKKNYKVNKMLLNDNFDVRQGDLFNVIKSNEKFDKIIFNPPYLPTKQNQKIGESGWFDIAVSGGKDGLFTTKRFICGLPKFLNKEVFAYFIYSSYSNRSDLEEYIVSKGMVFKIVSSKRYDDEILDVYCVYF